MHLLSDFPQLQASLHWAAAFQGFLQLQGQVQQCFAAEVLPVLTAHYMSGLGPSTTQVCISVSTVFTLWHPYDSQPGLFTTATGKHTPVTVQPRSTVAVSVLSINHSCLCVCTFSSPCALRLPPCKIHMPSSCCYQTWWCAGNLGHTSIRVAHSYHGPALSNRSMFADCSMLHGCLL